MYSGKYETFLLDCHVASLLAMTCRGLFRHAEPPYGGLLAVLRLRALIMQNLTRMTALFKGFEPFYQIPI